MRDAPARPAATPTSGPAGDPKASDGWGDLALRLLAAVASGLLIRFASPHWDLWWLGFVAWLPWLWAIDGQTPRRAFFIGYVSGLTAVFVGFFWMTELLTRFAGLPMPAAALVHLLFSGWQGLLWAFSALLIRKIQIRTGRSVLWVAPLCWAAVEALLPTLFPAYMALMWCWRPRMIQLAELGGVTTVSFVMCAMNSALWVVIDTYRREGRFDRAPLLALFGLWIGVPLYGTIRMAAIDRHIEAAPKVKFGVVQGNFGIATFAARDMKQPILRGMQEMSAQLEAQGAQIALWGETAYPYGSFHRESTTDLRLENRRRVRRGFDIPLIFGAVTRDHSGENPYPWNSALVLRADDSFGDRYDKVYPLMFGESVPLVDPEWYLEKIPTASYLNPGPGPATLRVDEWSFGPLICYEDILPRFVRQVARQDVNALVNLTNDSWFGDSAEPHEHLGLAVFRAVEHRKALLRSVNAGVSAHVDPAGRVLQRTEVTDPDNEGFRGPDGFVAEVAMMPATARSFYTRFGDLINGLFVLGVALSFRRRRDSAEPPSPPDRGDRPDQVDAHSPRPSTATEAAPINAPHSQ